MASRFEDRAVWAAEGEATAKQALHRGGRAGLGPGGELRLGVTQQRAEPPAAVAPHRDETLGNSTQLNSTRLTAMRVSVIT